MGMKELKSANLGNNRIYPISSVASFLGFKTIQEFKDKVLLKGLISYYKINGKYCFSDAHITAYLSNQEHKAS